MRIAIISDTHDNTPAIVWIIEYLNKQGIKVALHAGDLINPGILHRFRDHYEGHLYFVFGNNDGEKALAMSRSEAAKNLTCYPFEFKQEFGGKKFFMDHYSAISELMAKSGEFDVCIGGHDHTYRVKKYEKCLFINPGNCVTKDKWLQQPTEKESSFVILDTATMQTEKVVVPH
ncbi:MAG TPA: YfcE family phosphodiesterase [Candidatus Pacebacteria bacterium]|nr:YfcE family phosphodiesterase [Candidatus Paceibacterota bacterium]